MADPGGWGWGDPVMVEVNEIKGESSQIAFKVGQRFIHPLYAYKMEIIKIEVQKDNSFFNDYKDADIYVKSYFLKDEFGEFLDIGEYKVKSVHINGDKWMLIDEKRGE